MTLDEYEELTGTSVASSQRRAFSAQLVRTQRRLEHLLGFTLDPDQVTENLYTETGKTQSESVCSDIDDADLLPADAVVGAYRIFPYNADDRFLHVDPFSTVHAVKLISGDVTVRTFDSDEYVAQRKQGGWGKYLAVPGHWWLCRCQRNCVQLAVDADWLWDKDGDHDGLPEDLLDVWADMASSHADDKRNIKSESIGAHSYTKFDSKPPEKENASILKKYAGPNGAVSRMPA